MLSISPQTAQRLTILWLGLALVAFGWPSEAMPVRSTNVIAMLAHLVIYGSGTLIALRGWPDRPWRVLGGMLLLTPVSEIWQWLLPTNRFPDPLDVGFNAVGVLLAWSIVMGWQVRERQRGISA